jgi:hypothetical protein
MSIREYMHGTADVMFVSDLLKSARPDTLPEKAPRGSTIYERVREEQRRLENERFRVKEKRHELEEMKANLAEPCKRFQIHQQKDKRLECEALEAEIEHIESGERMAQFNERARPYIHEFQRQQFCRPLAKHQAFPQDTITPEESHAVLNEYMVHMEGEVPNFDIQSHDVCPDCQEAMQLYQMFSVLICPKCGRSKPFLDATASLLAYSDDYDYCSFSYKRINHFSEWLASIQAKETLDVPESVLQTIMQQLHDQRVQSNEEVTVHRVREILKKLKLRKYYEHVQLITCKITGRTPPRMTPEMEERIKVCFLAASSAFQRHCPPDRKNMISYQLVLLKLCELLGYHDFVPYFMLLKGKDKLSRMDSIWKKICEDLDWTYIPSIP